MAFQPAEDLFKQAELMCTPNYPLILEKYLHFLVIGLKSGLKQRTNSRNQPQKALVNITTTLWYVCIVLHVLKKKTKTKIKCIFNIYCPSPAAA